MPTLRKTDKPRRATWCDGQRRAEAIQRSRTQTPVRAYGRGAENPMEKGQESKAMKPEYRRDNSTNSKTMHTTEGKTVRFFHNSDYTGTVKIVVKSSKQEIEVPFDDIKLLVSEYVRDAKICRLENDSNPDSLLGL